MNDEEADDELEEVAILVLAMACFHVRRGAIGTSPALESAAYGRSVNGQRGMD